MLSFESDYNIGAHPEILRRLYETNFERVTSYGSDVYSESAKEKIKAECGTPGADVYFLTGGTQTNQIVIDTVLHPTEGVISADTGHINAHEAGAIEFTGHKVMGVPHIDGKIDLSALKAYLERFYSDENKEHMTSPGMVYISHPTEYGTLYSLDELTLLSDICRNYSLKLYMDGARLGYGLMSRGNDVTIRDIASLCDVFYIGGTKVGALCGEAVVFPKGDAPKHFFTSIKQHGALLAKGRLLGIQFDVLFTDGLYCKISRHAIDMADKMRCILRNAGYRFYIETVTNQIFVILSEEEYKRLSEKVRMSFWEKTAVGDVVVRFASSWATEDEDLDQLAALL